MTACKMTGIQTLSGSKDHEMFDSLSDAVRFNYHSMHMHYQLHFTFWFSN